MTKAEFDHFVVGASEEKTRPRTHFAKKVVSVKETTKGKVSYNYERCHLVTFTDGTSITVGNDYVEGHTKIQPGGYVVAESPDKTWGFVTEEQFESVYQ